MTYKIGVVGLGVMGANLARNIASRGFAVAPAGLLLLGLRANERYTAPARCSILLSWGEAQ